MPMSDVSPASQEPSGPGSADRSKLAARAIERAVVSALTEPPEAADATFSSVLEALLGTSASTHESLELKRRVAEARLSVFYSSIFSRSFAQAAWSELESLGYSSAEREASMLFYWCKHLALCGETDEVLACADRLEALQFGPEMSAAATHFAECAARLRASCKGAG
jgi:hypothetical protein